METQAGSSGASGKPQKPAEQPATDPELQAQKALKEKNEAAQAAIDSQKALINSMAELEKSKTSLLTSQLGTFTSTNQGTSVDVTETPFVAELIAQKALVANAEEIAKKINGLGGTIGHIMIVDSFDLCVDDVGRLQVESQIKSFTVLLKEKIQEIGTLLHEKPSKGGVPVGGGTIRAYTLPLSPVSAALTASAGILTGVSNILGFFQDQYTLLPAKVTPELVALQAAVAGRITKCPVSLNKFYRVDSSPLLDLLQEGFVQREKLSEKKNQLELDTAQNPDPKKEKIEKPLRKAAKSKAETLIKAFDDFFALITTIPSGASYSPVMVAVMRDIHNKLGITHYLFLKPGPVGGDVIKVKSIWPWKSGRMMVMAGSSCTAILVEKSGQVILAETTSPHLKKVRYQFNKFPKEA